MDETKFHIIADKYLQTIIAFFEELEENFDISPELNSGVMSVIMPDEREYVINKHTPSRQIWVSSPYSGASYFEPSESNDYEFVPKRAPVEAKNKTLFEFIKSEVESRL